MTLGEKIQHLRIQMNLSQDDLSTRIGVGGRHISRYENSKTTPSVEVIRKLSEVFGVTTDYLIRDDSLESLRDPDLYHYMKLIDQMDNAQEKEMIKRIIRGLVVDQRLSGLVPGEVSNVSPRPTSLEAPVAIPKQPRKRWSRVAASG